ncbi:TetR/AcrR family transcriptional regulator [Pyxidicoccus fallax]|uniref:TetR/AcrR family transcriptional regulator n=1 Tax=Pyxidicoccus fallax TaxID=394095 RepID=A0A848LLM1_9BACT|nr:TetR/AcrR family transcriptional regulator [Pyxidicoccus fallax]NMO18570.1 TetR/AcrR family transcriptional regulator [Pyxidicoccus fallax]NPC83065.1 TetR/AcrR family transcriptional regulator [Pyxidicoccus fallax]
MPTNTFFRLPEERRERLVNEAIIEFSERSYTEASLSQIARRASIPKGSVYQYFEDKLDLYRWLLTEEAPRRKREFIGAAPREEDFWARLETFIERGMAFLVEHPRLARLSASAAAPTAVVEVRGLYKAICDAGLAELRAVLAEGAASGDLKTSDLDVATRFVSTLIGPGLTDVILQELGAELHEVLASDNLRKRLNSRRRRALAQQTVLFIRDGLGAEGKRK